MNVSPDTVLPASGPAAGDLAPSGAAAVPRRRRWWLLLVALAGAALLVCGLLIWLAKAGDRPLAEVALPAVGDAAAPAELRRLEGKLTAEAPRGSYIVIDTIQNRLALHRGDQTLLDAACSTGTGAVLDDPATGRRWVFDTPKGAHRVQIKLRNPVWKKPDWAFIEEGKPLPSNPNDRFDFDALGDYGLYFGDGYLIHGTLYQRLLGRSVTHGCIRLGDDDLAALFKAAPIGTPIYIF
jgi:L,D-transpeptidase catalytic domain